MEFFQKEGVLLRDPKKLFHFCQYSSLRFISGYGIARIPHGGRILTSSFSEYLSVYGLMPSKQELAIDSKPPRSSKEAFDLGANLGDGRCSWVKPTLEPECILFNPIEQLGLCSKMSAGINA